MGPIGAAFKFRVELHAYMEAVPAIFYAFHDLLIRRSAANHHTTLFQHGAVIVIKLIAVPVPFLDQFLSIGFSQAGMFLDAAGITT